jgi:hypothetical protein
MFLGWKFFFKVFAVSEGIGPLVGGFYDFVNDLFVIV